MPFFRLRPTALFFFLCSAGACAAGTATTGTFGSGGETGNGGNGGAASSSAQSSSTGSDVGGGTFTSSTSGTGGSAPLDFAAYAHTGTTLYTIDPKAPSSAPKLVGDFDCIGGSGQDGAMTDLAVSQNGDAWGISDTKIYKLVVQSGKVHCATTITLPNPKATFYGLTFAPAGVLDPNEEVLVAGNTAGELWSVDTSNGTLTQHGNFGKVPASDNHGHNYANQGKAWELSGDIVFLANGGNPVGFAAVRDCPNPPSTTGCNATDTLIEINMAALKNVGTQSVTLKVRGQMVKGLGCSGADTAYQRMLGIAAWDDKVYGFSHNAAIVEIDNNTGSACLVSSTPGVFWNGAGVTTLAPVIKPPN
ncbi:MAG: hypothetical protein QM820_37845 [Minicystis sp.]